MTKGGPLPRILVGTLRVLGRGLLFLYGLAARALLYVVALYLCAYFFTNSSAFRRVLDPLLADALPGRMEASAYHWGPLPWRAGGTDLRFYTPEGKLVMEVSYADASVDILDLLSWLGGQLVGSEEPFRLHITRAEAERFVVRINVDEDGYVEFINVFDTPKHLKPQRPPGYVPKYPWLRIMNAVAVDGRAVLSFPDWAIDVNVDRAEADIEVRNALVDVIGPLVDIRNGRAIIREEPGGPIAVGIPIGETKVRDFRFDEPLLIFGHVETVAGENVRISASGTLDTEGEEAYEGVAVVDVYGRPEGLPEHWLPELSGATRLSAWGAGTIDEPNVSFELVSPGLSFAGVDFQAINVEGEVEQNPEPGVPWVLRLDRIGLDAGGGVARILGARYSSLGPPALRGQRAEAEFLLSDIDLNTMLADVGIASAPGPARGRVSGDLQVEAETFLGQDDRTWRVQSTLQVDVRWPGDPDWPLSRKFSLKGRVGFDESDGQRLTAERMRLRSGTDELNLTGGVSLDSGELDISARGNFRHIERLLAPLGVDGIQGRLRVHRLALSGELGHLNGQARVALEEANVLGLGPGEVQAQASLTDGRLRISSFDSTGPWGRVEGRGSTRLPWPFSPQDAALPFHLEKLHARGIQLAELVNIPGLRGAVDVTLRDVKGDWKRPLSSLRGRGQISAPDIRYRKQRLRGLSARLTMRRREFVVEDVQVFLGRHGAIKATASLSKDLKRGTVDLFVDPVPSRIISQLVGEDLPATGRAGLSLHAQGRLRDPSLEGTIRFQGIQIQTSDDRSLSPLSLGNANIDFSRKPGEPVLLASDAFFPGFSLRSSSQLGLRGTRPRGLRVDLDVAGFDLSPVLPLLDELKAKASVAGRATLDLRFGRKIDWTVKSELPSGALRLSLHDGQVEFTNLAPAKLSYGPEGLRVSQFQLSGSDGTLLFACGELDKSGNLDALVGGVVTTESLRLIGRRAFSRLEGRVKLAGRPGVDPSGQPAACEATIPIATHESVRLTGDIGNPRIDGRVTLLGDLTLQPRGMGREVVVADGTSFDFIPEGADGGEQLVRLSREAPLRGSIDEGAFSLWGDVSLSRMLPDDGELHMLGTDIFFASRKSFNATFNTDLTLVFRDLFDEEKRYSQLSGELDVTEGAYFQSFDTLARALEGTGGRSQDTPTQSVVQAMPWLADTELDMRVTGSDVNLRSAFTFGTTDLSLRMDLAVKGTLVRPLIWDRIEVIPGGEIVYRIVRREFEVTRGTLDFRGDASEPYLDIEAQTEIEYTYDTSSSLSTIDAAPLDSERIVTITVRIKGRYPKIDLELSSDNQAFDQTDLQYFILTGAPRDTTQGADSERSISLLTEDLANLASKLLLSAFVDAITLGVTPGGGIDWGVIASLGRRLKLRTRMVQEGTDRLYRARFEFRITERLSLEGQLKVNEEENESFRTYESKLRYRIPLD